jgi:hypothetical protein
MRILALLFAVSLGVQLAEATPSDFNFTAVPVVMVTQTIATLGKFNVLVAPELQEKALDYSRRGVEPVEALEDVAKAVGGSLMEVKGTAARLFVLTATPLAGDVEAPAGAASDGSLTDFSFKSTQLKNIVQTMAVLGKFTVLGGDRRRTQGHARRPGRDGAVHGESMISREDGPAVKAADASVMDAIDRRQPTTPEPGKQHRPHGTLKAMDTRDDAPRTPFGQRPRRCADKSWHEERRRIESLSAWERMLEALSLGSWEPLRPRDVRDGD